MTNKLILLIVTALPGFIKVFLFILVEKLYSIDVLGNFSNDYYLAQLFIIVTAVGLSGIVMVNIPKVEEYKNHITKIINTSFLYCIFILPIFLIFYKFNLFYFIDSFVLLISMSIYLIIRHFFLARKEYINLFYYDLFLLFLLTIFLVFFDQLNVIQKIYIPYLIIVILFIFKTKKINIKILDIFDIKQSFHISLTNFFSGGIFFLIIPLSTKTLGNEYTALLGIVLTISSIIILLPRAISTFYLPSMAKNIQNKEFSNNLYKRLLKINFITLFLLFISTFILLYIIKFYFFKDLFSLKNSEILYILFMLSILVSQISLIPSNFIMVLKKNEFTFKLNIILSLIYFLLSTVFIIIFNINNLIYFLFFIIIIGNIIRYVLLKNYAQKEINA